MTQHIAILGGSFDPPHRAHLQVAEWVYAQGGFQEIRFLPCQQQVLKQHTPAASKHRLAMLKLACDKPYYTIDEREITRASPSYAVESLQSLHAEKPNTRFYFIVGSDAFLQLPQWHQVDQLLGLCHWIIIARSEFAKSAVFDVITQYKLPRCENMAALQAAHTMSVIYCDTLQIDLSATQLRAAIAAGKDVSQDLTPAVAAYIQKHQLYVDQA